MPRCSRTTPAALSGGFEFLLDVGCGLGSATLLLARAFPRSRFVGVDNHAAAVRGAIEAARAALVCVAGSLSQAGRAGLGAQAGPGRLLAIVRDAGFEVARVAATTPYNLVLEAR